MLHGNTLYLADAKINISRMGDNVRRVGGVSAKLTKLNSVDLTHSGKFSLVQTFAKTPPETPEEIFIVLICSVMETTPYCQHL